MAKVVGTNTIIEKYMKDLDEKGVDYEDSKVIE